MVNREVKTSMSKRNKLMAITVEDVAFIFNDNKSEFDFITSHCYCRHCNNGYESTIVNYTISLNSLNDIELSGYCSECNTKMGRYIETGENRITVENAKAIWETNAALKELKIKKTR